MCRQDASVTGSRLEGSVTGEIQWGMSLHEEVLHSETIYEGRVITVRLDRIRLPDGTESTREVVIHQGAVAIVPFLSSETLLMVRQYRRAVDEVLLELPAGTREPGEPTDTCAARELEEETGYRAGSLRRLFKQYLAPGYSSECLVVYEARDLTPGTYRPDFDERLEVVEVPVSEVAGKITGGEIKDAKSIAGLLVALR